MLERTIEAKVCHYAKITHNWWCLKLNIIAMRGFPDRMLLKKPARVVFIEFKKRGGCPRPNQVFVMAKLQELGFACYVIDDVEEGKRLVDELG